MLASRQHWDSHALLLHSECQSRRTPHFVADAAQPLRTLFCSALISTTEPPPRQRMLLPAVAATAGSKPCVLCCCCCCPSGPCAVCADAAAPRPLLHSNEFSQSTAVPNPGWMLVDTSRRSLTEPVGMPPLLLPLALALAVPPACAACWCWCCCRGRLALTVADHAGSSGTLPSAQGAPACVCTQGQACRPAGSQAGGRAGRQVGGQAGRHEAGGACNQGQAVRAQVVWPHFDVAAKPSLQHTPLAVNQPPSL